MDVVDILNGNFNSIQQQLVSDPRIEYMLDTFRCLGYTFFTNFKIWVKLAKFRQSESDLTNYFTRDNVTAGTMYNRMVVSGQYSITTAPTNIELSDQEFEYICKAFVNATESFPRINNIIKDFIDPKDAMFDLCNIFFIPLRLSVASLPHSVKILGLRKWINIVFVLPFISTYVKQFENTNSQMCELHGFYKELKSDIDSGKCTKVNAITTRVTPEMVEKSIITPVLISTRSVNIFRLSMNLILFASIDIIKHYCPNYETCHQITKEYDGGWLVAHDPYYIKHISKLNELQTYIRV